MPQRLTDIRIDRVSLVDKGANARVIAILKQATVRKDVPTFSALQGASALRTWLPVGVEALVKIVDSAVAGDPADEAVTPELRLDAVRGSLAQFSDELLQRVAAAIVAGGSSDPDDVAKSSASVWTGLL